MRCKIPSADLSQKLHDSICRYKGEPVYITVDKTKINVHKLTDTHKPFEIIKPSDPDFDISGVPLGYLQYNPKEVMYLTRIPVRKTKQGLDVRYVRARKLIDNSVQAKGSSINYVFSQGFVDMVTGKYPHAGDAIKKLRGIYAKEPKAQAQVALSRNLAMWIDEMGRINIHYKGEFVGWVQPDKFIVHVPSNNDMGWVISKYLSHELSWEID